MGRYIAKQPNGKYCVFSTVVDTVIGSDFTKEEVINFCIEEDMQAIKRNIESEVKHAYDFSKVVRDFTSNNETQEEFNEFCKKVGWKA